MNLACIIGIAFTNPNIVAIKCFSTTTDRSSVMTPVHGPLTRYVKLRVAHVPGMPGMYSPPPQVRDPFMHHGTCVSHVPRCMPGSLTCVFLWSWWRGKRSRHSRRMRNPQFYVSGKRPIEYQWWSTVASWFDLYGPTIIFIYRGS